MEEERCKRMCVLLNHCLNFSSFIKRIQRRIEPYIANRLQRDHKSHQDEEYIKYNAWSRSLYYSEASLKWTTIFCIWENESGEKKRISNMQGNETRVHIISLFTWYKKYTTKMAELEKIEEIHFKIFRQIHLVKRKN